MANTVQAIVDDDINKLLIRGLGIGVTLHILIDACHCGTACDLKYNLKMGVAGGPSWEPEYERPAADKVSPCTCRLATAP